MFDKVLVWFLRLKVSQNLFIYLLMFVDWKIKTYARQ